MTRRTYIIFAALLVYSILLIGVEWFTSQAGVRNYVTDLKGPVLFYGINTTLSAFLMWAIALLHLINISATARYHMESAERWFLISQIIIFCYLGFDERFQFHERLGQVFHVEDAFILLGIGVIELGCLFGLGKVHTRPQLQRLSLLMAGCCFGLMVIIDAFFPSGMRMRLSAEDLTKIWAVAFLFLFAWQVLFDRLRMVMLDAPGSNTPT